jgi:hypothetical protein
LASQRRDLCAGLLNHGTALRDLRRAGIALRDLASNAARAASSMIETSRQLSMPSWHVHEAADKLAAE